MAKTKRDERAANTADRSLNSSRPADVGPDDIARHAYDRYLARGCEHGYDAEDWFQAERELREDDEC